MDSDNFNNEEEYLQLLGDIRTNGVESDDRTGVGTYRVFGRQLRFDLRDSFPLLTTKKMIWASIVSELLWFIEGSGDERRLAEIRYGKPREELTGKTTIWTENAHSPYWKPKAKFDGDCGNIYGVMWRKWPGQPLLNGSAYAGRQTIDQLQNLIEGIKKDPSGRRHLLTAWNPAELGDMALPPCHVLSQFYVLNGELSCLMTQRSGDTFLGVPYNIASYSLLTLMIAHVCGLKPGEFILSLGDAHIYKNHVEQVDEQISRDILSAPTVTLNPEVTDITQFKMEDIVLHDYEPQEAIKAPMAV